ncbi:uncharacterized protein [Prorops nasuta]|uniref:uncharacterized protein n=1 Tax=Prorops nasuta TaxID=863751 RepID=UPI0034CE5E5E
MSQHSEATRGRAIDYFECGKSASEIAVLCWVHETTVRRWIRRYREGGDHALRDRRAENRGQKRTSEIDDQQLLNRIEEDPFASVSDIVEEIDYPASVTTGLRRLHSAGIHCRRPARKIPLTPAHREQRVGYALANLSRSRADWKATIWTDEKVFISLPSQAQALHMDRIAWYKKGMCSATCRIQKSALFRATNII